MLGDELFESYRLNLLSAIENVGGALQDAQTDAGEDGDGKRWDQRAKKLKERLDFLKERLEDLKRRPPGQPTVPKYTNGELSWVPADGTYDPSSTIDTSRVRKKHRLPSRQVRLIVGGVAAAAAVAAAVIVVSGGGGPEERVSANSPSSVSSTSTSVPRSSSTTTSTVASSSTSTVATTNSVPTTAAPAATTTITSAAPTTTAAPPTTVAPSGVLSASGFESPTWTEFYPCQNLVFNVTNESDTEVMSAAFTFALSHYDATGSYMGEVVEGPGSASLGLPPGGSTALTMPVCVTPSDFAAPGDYFLFDRTCYVWTWKGGATGAYAPGDC